MQTILLFWLFHPSCTFGIHLACQNHGHMGVEFFFKCEDSMDKHGGAFETCDGRI